MTGREAELVLADGRRFRGKRIGAGGSVSGEVVFCTTMTGYLEVMTDPSYAGQIVVMTYPLIGNYGIDPASAQSSSPKVKGLIVREAARYPSHVTSQTSLRQYMEAMGVVGLEGIDTRALTRHLRSHGTIIGRIGEVGDPLPREGAVPPDVVDQVTAVAPYHVGEDGPLVAVLDLGLKANILEELTSRGAQAMVFPARTSAEDILHSGAQGVLVTNGPGDPQDLPHVARTVSDLAGKVPIFGICLGHQVLALSFGGDTYKLKFGHRGGNHPVMMRERGRAILSSQNHGYAVEPKSLEGTPLVVTHHNLNDQTVEGMRHRDLPIWSLQYHPEASPGPWEGKEAFEEFLRTVKRNGEGTEHAEA